MAIEAAHVADNKFKVRGNRTDEFIAGRRVKADCGEDGVRYFTVKSSSYSSPLTTVTVEEDNVSTKISQVLYSVVASGAAGGLPAHDHSNEDQGGDLELESMSKQPADEVDITGGSAVGMTVIGFKEEMDNGAVDEDTEINWNLGNNQAITLEGSVALSFTNMKPGHKQLRVIQDSEGGRVPELPSGKWPGGEAGEFSTAVDAEDILSIFNNGSDYYFMLSKDWG